MDTRVAVLLGRSFKTQMACPGSGDREIRGVSLVSLHGHPVVFDLDRRHRGLGKPPLFQQPKDRAVVPFVAGMPVELNLLVERRMVETGGTLFKSAKDLGAVMRVEKTLAQLLTLLEAERLLST